MMSKMKNFMMDVEEFCNGYAYGGEGEFDFDEVAATAELLFRSNMAGAYAKNYLKRQYGE